jgi:hypothetical protein
LNEQEGTNEQPVTKWAISLDWFETNNRSARLMIKEYVCPNCAGELEHKKKPPTPQELVNRVQKCAQHTPDFINHKMPIMESIFRLFLSNGNKPLSLEEISQQLTQLREGDSYRTSPELLLNLLTTDRYYGLQMIME